jgi:pimeloyl-ACP methyl ester carboxylesterase
MTRIESLLSARLFLVPQLVGERIFFISNLHGRMSLYAMEFGGSVPEPLLPPHIALQNPHLMSGDSFVVLPELDSILVMIDQDGDENYQPTLIPIDGGFPEPIFGEQFADHRVMAGNADLERNIVYFVAESRQESLSRAYRANLATGEITQLSQSRYGGWPAGRNEQHTRTLIIEAYGAGDHVLYLTEGDWAERQLLYGVPLEERQPGQEVPPNSVSTGYFVDDDTAVVCFTSVFSDTYGLGCLDLAEPGELHPVTVEGIVHDGLGEMDRFERLRDNGFLIGYNVDGCSWIYEAQLDGERRVMKLERVLVGQGRFAGGVLESLRYDKADDRFSLSFSTATTPTQIYTIAGPERQEVAQHTRERVLGIAPEWLAPGEDASFTSYDGLRISARLYLPAAALGYDGPRPLVYYIHGGPQSQERPDFAWFSMPLIQFLTLQGFAVFVPNVRGSTGYGYSYMKHVVRDWGGQDRLDHVHAMTEILPHDERLDAGRAGVVGRSYGGFMTLTLASRHPELWSAAVDMFGPYDLPSFAERVPETWKPFMRFLVGDPETERDFLLERSPRTYIDGLACPLLVIQGKNDPRVLEVESRQLVEELRAQGKQVDYLMFEDEGHDILKHENKVRCYNAITDFFKQHLRP